MDWLAPLLEASVRTATPLAIAALGETVSERAGIINIGLEGSIVAGCLGAVVGASVGGDVASGLVMGLLAGMVVSALVGAFTITLRADQILTGTAVTLGAYGATSALYRGVFGDGGVALTIPTLRPLPIPFLAELPVVGGALFAQPVTTYLALTLLPIVWFGLYRTGFGLNLRAVGEQPGAALAAGVSTSVARWTGVLVGGLCGGLAGCTLVLAQAGTFSEQMSGGRGFMAIAIVALGRWTPHGAVMAALVFGGATALQFLFQARGDDRPYQLFLALPYVLTVLALAFGTGRSRAPAALGRVATD